MRVVSILGETGAGRTTADNVSVVSIALSDVPAALLHTAESLAISESSVTVRDKVVISDDGQPVVVVAAILVETGTNIETVDFVLSRDVGSAMMIVSVLDNVCSIHVRETQVHLVTAPQA